MTGEHITPSEVYHFKYTPEDIAAVYTSSKKTYIIPLCVVLAIAALLLWAYSAESVAITCAIFIVIFPGVPYLKGYIKFKKSWPVTYERLLSCVYNYEVYDTYFNISITRNGETIRTSKLYFSEIDKIQTVGNHLHITHSNQIFLLRRSDLPETSVFYGLMRAPKKASALAQKPPKSTTKKDTLETVSWILFAASIGVFLLSGRVALTFSPYAIWLLAAFAVVPLASIVFGIIANKKGVKGTKNIVVGIIITILLGLIFVTSFFANLVTNSADYTNPEIDAVAITRAEQILETELLGTTSYYSYDQSEEALCEDMHYFCYFDLSDESKQILDEHITDSTRWTTYTDLAEIAPYTNKYIFSSAILIYNTDTGEYNKLPETDGTYHFISLVYTPDSATLNISEYDVEYVK